LLIEINNLIADIRNALPISTMPIIDINNTIVDMNNSVFGGLYS